MEQIELSTLISEVRHDLAGMTPDLMEDETILPKIKRAYVYINNIIDPTFNDDEFYREGLIALSTYFTYVDLVSLQMVNLETAPPFSWQQNAILKSTALAYIRQMTRLPIKDDLSVDYTQIAKMKVSSVALTQNIWG